MQGCAGLCEVVPAERGGSLSATVPPRHDCGVIECPVVPLEGLILFIYRDPAPSACVTSRNLAQPCMTFLGHFFDHFVSITFDPNLEPTWPQLDPQLGAKLGPKSIKNRPQDLIHFLIDFLIDFWSILVPTWPQLGLQNHSKIDEKVIPR